MASPREHHQRPASELDAVIAHQLRTPLSVIRLNLDMLRTEAASILNREHVELMDEIDEATKTIQVYVEDAFRVASLGTPRGVRQPERVNLRVCLEEVIAAYESFITRSILSIERVFPVPDIFLYEDPHFLRVVFDAILSNAVKYSPRGGRIRIAVQEVAGAAEVCFSDEGPGIPEHLIEAVFRPWFRGSNVEQHTEGSGLGLYLASKVMDECIHGDISIHSAAGSGSTICCTLPIYRDTTTSEEEESNMVSAQKSTQDAAS
ncbi:MAG: HAMP domain-containing sensor histidine kinase [bacterium]|nr:HAMP domain-containing sensor histidine kinase [bacterium]